MKTQSKVLAMAELILVFELTLAYTFGKWYKSL